MDLEVALNNKHSYKVDALPHFAPGGGKVNGGTQGSVAKKQMHVTSSHWAPSTVQMKPHVGFLRSP